MKGLVAVILILDCFFMAWWIPESNGGYNDVIEARTKVSRGAYEGIRMDSFDYERNEIVLDFVDNYLTDEDKVLVVFGTKSTGYLNMDSDFATYGAYARCHVNNKLLDYWEVNPDNRATKIILDMSDPSFERFELSDTAIYIKENYPNVIAERGAFVLLGQ